jgi:hypothetical protein
MLSTLLDRLGSLLPKHFIVASFMPVLIFAFVNACLLAWNARWFWTWARPQIDGFGKATFVTGSILVGLAVTAYVLSTINVFLREALEGKHVAALLPSSLFVGRQREVRDRILKGYEEARSNARAISNNRAAWQQALGEAARLGVRANPGVMKYDGQVGYAVTALEKVRGQYRTGAPIANADLADAVRLLAHELEVNDVRQPDPSGHEALADDHGDLVLMMDNAEDAWAAQEVRTFTEAGYRFPVGEVAPTAMGNIAESMKGYAYSRYQLNLDTFWSRMQPVLQTKKDFYAGLLDAKTQLDFLVACCWLSGVTTAVWTLLWLWEGHGVAPFLLVAISGPLATRFFYFLAVKNYLAFGDLMRTSVDLYRLELLRSLNLPVPRGIRDERALWRALERVASYGQKGDDLGYQLSDKPEAAPPVATGRTSP